MTNNLLVEIERRKGNTHIRLDGNFTPQGAARVVMLMAKNYEGKGNIFLHTEKITAIDANSRYAFEELLETSGLLSKHVYLIGEKGLKLCRDNAKVIIRKKKKSHCGKCKNCTGRKKKAA